MKITDVETAMKAKEIVKRAFPLDKRNTRYVAPVKLERAPKGFKVTTVTKIPGQRARQQVFRCNMSPGYNGYFNDCPDVQCDCSCGRYKFVWNYALNQRGAAIKDRTNGEAPIVTNPGEIPGICKHGVLALRLLSTTNPYWMSIKAKENTGKAIRLTNLDATLKRIRRNRI